MDVSYDSALCSSDAHTPTPIKGKRKSRRTRRHYNRSSDLALSSSQDKITSTGLRPRSKSDLGLSGQMSLRAFDNTDSEEEKRATVQPGSLVLAKSVEQFIEKYPAKSTDFSSDSGNESSPVKDTMLENAGALSTSVNTFTSTAFFILTSPTERTWTVLADGHFVQGWTVSERRRLFEE